MAGAAKGVSVIADVVLVLLKVAVFLAGYRCCCWRYYYMRKYHLRIQGRCSNTTNALRTLWIMMPLRLFAAFTDTFGATICCGYVYSL